MANSTASFNQKDILGVLVSKRFLDAQKADFIRKHHSDLISQAKVLLDKKLVKEADLVKAAATVLNLPFIKIQGRALDRAVLQIIPLETSQKLKILAFERQGNLVKVAVSQPYRLSSGKKNQSGPLHQLEKEKGIRLELYAAPLEDVEWGLKVYQKFAQKPIDKIDKKVKISNLPFQDLTKIELNPQVIQKFPPDIIKKYQIALFEIGKDGSFKVGMVDPFDKSAQEVLNFISSKNQVKIDKFQIDSKGLDRILETYNQNNQTRSAPVKPPSATGKTAKNSQLPPGVELKKGIFIISESAIQKPKTRLDKEGLQVQPDQNLEETNLDKFLGKMVEDAQELVLIIISGFIPKIVAAILSLGVRVRASDIHLEPSKKYLRLRYRIDGDLRDFIYLPLKLHPPLISRIKILSGLKIDEQRIPQDGRYDAVAASHEIDVRVSTFPTIHAEKVVMRILDKTTSQYTLNQLGLEGANLEKIAKEIKKPWGVIVSTGPTGSGKTTTLYAILNTISNPKINIITLEDPVEYDVPGINQAQIKPKIGFSFAEGLRSVLRQDPNVIMVGEIRDSETANLVTHAALTGHLVLTTLHTNDAASTLPRLTDMKVEPYLITSSINVIIAQRLIRKLCDKCKRKVKVPAEVLEKEVGHMANPDVFYGPGKGCSECHEGYKGRVGIFEVLVMTDEIERLAIAKSPASKIREEAIKQGMITLKQDGINKAKKGLVSLGDVLQAVS